MSPFTRSLTGHSQQQAHAHAHAHAQQATSKHYAGFGLDVGLEEDDLILLALVLEDFVGWDLMLVEVTILLLLP